MKKARIFLFIQSFLCVLLAALLIAAVITVYIDGYEASAENPAAPVFSREIVTECLDAAAPLFWACVIFAAACLILGIRDEDSLTPSKDGKTENRTADGKTVRTVLLAAAAVLIFAGILNGSAKDVFARAVKICAECIGLG